MAASADDFVDMPDVVIGIGGDDLVDDEEARKLEESGKLRQIVNVDRLDKVCA